MIIRTQVEIEDMALKNVNANGYSKIYPEVENISGNDANTELLIHSDTTNGSTTFTDSSSNNFTITKNGTPKHLTNISKFGKSAMYFDANDTYIDAPNSANLGVGSGEFTSVTGTTLTWETSTAITADVIVGYVFGLATLT